MGSLCRDSAPTFYFSHVFKRMRCLVACCSSEVDIELRDETNNYDEENAQEEDLQSGEPSVRETVL